MCVGRRMISGLEGLVCVVICDRLMFDFLISMVLVWWVMFSFVNIVWLILF